MAPTAILAEDEPLLRAQLKTKLARLWPELQILADVGDGESALDAIAELQPNFAFLDIQMPELTGIDVARRLLADPDMRCQIVFVTAFDQYAVDAFETGAADYLLKPYTDDRLAATIERLKSRSEAAPAADEMSQLRQMLQKLAAGAPAGHAVEPLRWIKAGTGDKLKLIPVEDVLFFHADTKYTLVATHEADALIRVSIKELADTLDPALFWQIHRATIVNARMIDSVVRDFRGQASVRIKDRSEQLVVSRPYAHLFKQM